MNKNDQKPSSSQKPATSRPRPYTRGENPGKPPFQMPWKRTVKEIAREATAGGVIYRQRNGRLQILLIQDALDRWTIPKGHIEPGETAQEAAIREIAEETGMNNIKPIVWLGKVHFNYKRENTLVMITQQVYLFKALGDTDALVPEDWMNDIAWHDYEEAVELVDYPDIKKIITRGYSRLKQKGEV